VIDAPVIGNHWVLQGLVSLGLLGAAAHVAVGGRRSGTGFSRRRLAAVALPLVRWSALCFYVFAAFSKLNWGFVDSTVSCANVFADGSLRSFGLPGHLTGGSGWIPRVLPWVALSAEVAVPILLVRRRTRYYGLALALVFHSLVSLDRDHPIADFGSYLLASYILFLPPSFFAALGHWVQRRIGIVEKLASALLFVVATLVVVQANGRGSFFLRVLAGGRWALWIALDAVVLALALAFLVRVRFKVADDDALGGGVVSPLQWPAHARWLLVVPALIVFNGLTPYLEVKTAYGWNMYSNLRTVDGDSNHFLVRHTATLSNAQDDMVEILSSSDGGLQDYADRRFALPMLQLRDYLSDHPDAALQFRRRGAVVDVARAGDVPELVEPLTAVERRLLAFRASTAVGAGPEQCQPTWLAAH
jgi:hypothetical protein